METKEPEKKKVEDNTETSQMPLFERAIIGAQKRLKTIEIQGKLQKKIDKIFHTFNRAFEDIQKALPDATELEIHSDRVCFEIRDVPISVIYVPQSQPTFISLNKQSVMAEKIFICDKYFGKNSYEMVGPSEREVGGIYICEESYLIRWQDGRAFFYPTVYELVDASLGIFFGLHEMYKDRLNNILEINLEDWHYKVTPLDLLTSSAGDLGSSAPGEAKTDIGGLGMTQAGLAPVKKNITIYGHKNMKF